VTLSDALTADRAGEYESAAALYEETLRAGTASLEVILNLALLYWQASDPGTPGLGREFLSMADRRLPELLDEACRRFPDSTAARFWSRYIAWADWGGEMLSKAECSQLLQENPNELAPVMSIFEISNGQELIVEARELLRRSRAYDTVGARYVSSVIESVMKRAGYTKSIS
jgi:hypothetical protein